MKFNINDYVRVKLTPHGRFLLEKKHHEFYEKYRIANREYTPYKEDDNGWSTWQLWNLMNYLGEYITMGAELPFETNIEIVEKIPPVQFKPEHPDDLPSELFEI